MKMLRIGTRGSRLARAQTRLVETHLQAVFPSLKTQIIEIKTSGDLYQEQNISQIGGKGVFVKEIEQSLINGETDIAVHSMKDMPSDLPDGLIIGAVLKRDDPRDSFVSRDPEIVTKPFSRARIGTGSERRRIQLLFGFAGVQVVPIRGNIDTRLAKINSECLDGVVLAVAGLNKLGFLDRITEYFSLQEMVPAPCQGVVAVQCREDDMETRDLLSEINCLETEPIVAFERSFLRAFGGDCSIPLGCCAQIVSGKIVATAFFADMEKNRFFRNSWKCDIEDASSGGVSMAKSLISENGFSF